MYNFYPGPSRIDPAVKGYANEAFETGILEKNHRSEDFMQLLEECIEFCKARLNIPASYKVFFTSSATECWEICAQSFLREPLFYHNGAFGEKWRSYTERITGKTRSRPFGVQEMPEPVSATATDVCLVANETSNGSAISPLQISKFRESTGGLLVMDAVSSFGAVDYAVEDADIWISCTQKCLGLPSGLGIMAVSPAALERAREVADRRYYNSALFVEENFDRFQTPYTPNILGIYLLKRLLENRENVQDVAIRIRQRAGQIYDFLEGTDYLEALVQHPDVRSVTVVAVSGRDIAGVIRYLEENGAIAGKGYGEWRDSTFRIANFPAISDTDYEVLFGLLRTFALR